MTTVEMVLSSLCELAPLERKLDFDNVGLLVGDARQSVFSVLLTLDITKDVIEEAGTKGCQLIVSHHPLFFSLPKALRFDCPETANVAQLLQSGVSAVCMHTNLDLAAGGVNDVLLTRLQLAPAGAFGEDALGRVGFVQEEMPAGAFAAFVKQALGCRVVRFVDAGRPVSKVAVVGGSGGDQIEAALLAGCDTLVTADVKHHQFLEAQDRAFNLIDAGHYHTEHPVLDAVYALLQQRHPELTLLRSSALEQDRVLIV